MYSTVTVQGEVSKKSPTTDEFKGTDGFKNTA